MFLKKKIDPVLIFCLALFGIMLGLSLSIAYADLSSGFGDPYEYLAQAKISLLDPEFYFRHRIGALNPRPFTIPLFYKIAGYAPENIVMMQKIVHCLSTAVLAYTISLFITKKIIRYLAVVCIFIFMSWWNIFGWSLLVLSESLSISLLFLWISSLLLVYKKNNLPSILFYCFITVLFSFTRDQWPYVILVLSGCLLLISIFYHRSFLKTASVLFLFGGIVFGVQQYSAEVGQRYKISVANSIIVRVIPNEEYTQWFIDKGMPCSDSLKKNLMNIDPMGDLTPVYRLYGDTAYNAFFNWITSGGKKSYMHFLITHPNFAFLREEKKELVERIMSHDLPYARWPRGFTNWFTGLFPAFNIFWVIVLPLLVLFYRKKDQYRIFFIPIALVVAFAVNVIVSYNADALEVPRHLVITNIMVQFIGTFSLLLLVDVVSLNSLLERIKAFRKRKG